MNPAYPFAVAMILLLVGYFTLKKSPDVESAILSVGYFEGGILFAVIARFCVGC